MGIVAFIVGILALVGVFTGMAPTALGVLGVVFGIIGIAINSYVGLSWLGLILSAIAIALVYFGVAGSTAGRRL